MQLSTFIVILILLITIALMTHTEISIGIICGLNYPNNEILIFDINEKLGYGFECGGGFYIPIFSYTILLEAKYAFGLTIITKENEIEL